MAADAELAFEPVEAEVTAPEGLLEAGSSFR